MLGIAQMNERRIAIFLGTRPEAVKLAPVQRALARTPRLVPFVISTGQHREMLDDVLGAANVPVHRDLRLMAHDQALATLSARVLEAVDAVLAEEPFAFALVQGDTTSAAMAALACFYRRVPVGHVEAGLRTGDLAQPFPEEGNRKLVTALATLHFAPTPQAKEHLLHEGVPADRVHVTGNTVVDALLAERARQIEPPVHARIAAELAGLLRAPVGQVRFVLVTAHRRESFGPGLAAFLRALGTLARRFPAVRFVFPVHRNPSIAGPVHAALASEPNLVLLPPLRHELFVALLAECAFVLSDSGGVQEEAPSFGKHVLVLRELTERPEGLAAGHATLVGTDEARIVAAVSERLALGPSVATGGASPYGDGHASERIAALVAEWLA